MDFTYLCLFPAAYQYICMSTKRYWLKYCGLLSDIYWWRHGSKQDIYSKSISLSSDIDSDFLVQKVKSVKTVKLKGSHACDKVNYRAGEIRAKLKIIPENLGRSYKKKINELIAFVWIIIDLFAFVWTKYTKTALKQVLRCSLIRELHWVQPLPMIV